MEFAYIPIGVRKDNKYLQFAVIDTTLLSIAQSKVGGGLCCDALCGA